MATLEEAIAVYRANKDMLPVGSLVVIGVDPGRTSGVAAMTWSERAGFPDIGLFQADPSSVIWLVKTLVEQARAALHHSDPVAVAVERYVVGPRSSRSRDAKAGEITRELVAQIKALDGVAIHARSAAEVKPWATDDRLKRLGLGTKSDGMRHAWDGARHASFAAVSNYGIPDPFSKKRQVTA